MVGFVAAAAGVGAILASSWLGLGAGKAMGLGGLAAGGLAWLLGKHDGKLHPCSIFFIPLRFYASLLIAAGVGCFLLPDRPETPADPRVGEIARRLGKEIAGGSSGAAQEVAARLAALKDPALGADEKRCHLALDSSDLKAVRKAELYVRASKLRDRDDDGKRALCAAYLKALRAEFPQAACHVAVRGLFLWGVQGGAAAGTAPPAIQVGSDDPRF